MSTKKSYPSPLTILMIVIVIAATTTWLLPAGEYSKLSSVDNKIFRVISASGSTTLPFTQRTLDSLSIKIPLQKFIDGDIRKPVSVPGSYKPMEKTPQGFIKILEAPVQGIIDSIDIALFVLIIGGFMYVFNETGAILKGVQALSFRMKGKEPLLIIILVFLFSFLRASYGMEEESLVFYPVLVPLFLAAGYDLLLPVAVIFGGTSVGGIAAFTNPFSTIIASNAAGINWMDGLYERLLVWAITTALMTWYILRYAVKVKKDHSASLVLKIDGIVRPPYEMDIKENEMSPVLSLRTKLLLFIYLATFITMII